MSVCVCIGICTCAAAVVAIYFNYTKIPDSHCVGKGGITSISEKEIEF
jgi:hypothetical protein